MNRAISVGIHRLNRLILAENIVLGNNGPNVGRPAPIVTSRVLTGPI